jgi:hypothetical protein
MPTGHPWRCDAGHKKASPQSTRPGAHQSLKKPQKRRIEPAATGGQIGSNAIPQLEFFAIRGRRLATVAAPACRRRRPRLASFATPLNELSTLPPRQWSAPDRCFHAIRAKRRTREERQ